MFLFPGDIIVVVIFMNEKNNVPQWILDSKTGIEQQDDRAGLVVASFIGAFRKRGFEQKEIGIMMTQAFLLPLEEVEKRIDAVLSCGEENSEQAKKLCLYSVQKGCLFDNNQSDPCEIIEFLKKHYGKEGAFETLLTYPEILRLWKNNTVRDLPEFAKDKAEAEKILNECSQVFPFVK